MQYVRLCTLFVRVDVLLSAEFLHITSVRGEHVAECELCRLAIHLAAWTSHLSQGLTIVVTTHTAQLAGVQWVALQEQQDSQLDIDAATVLIYNSWGIKLYTLTVI